MAGRRVTPSPLRLVFCVITAGTHYLLQQKVRPIVALFYLQKSKCGLQVIREPIHDIANSDANHNYAQEEAQGAEHAAEVGPDDFNVVE